MIVRGNMWRLQHFCFVSCCIRIWGMVFPVSSPLLGSDPSQVQNTDFYSTYFQSKNALTFPISGLKSRTEDWKRSRTQRTFLAFSWDYKTDVEFIRLQLCFHLLLCPVINDSVTPCYSAWSGFKIQLWRHWLPFQSLMIQYHLLDSTDNWVYKVFICVPSLFHLT